MDTRRRPSRTAVPLALASLSVGAAVTAAAVMATGAIDWTVGLVRLRSDSPDRSLLLGLASTVVLLLFRWRSTAWRRLGAMLLVVLGTLGLLTTDTGPTWPVGDGALIELYTLHAAQGHLLVVPAWRRQRGGRAGGSNGSPLPVRAGAP